MGMMLPSHPTTSVLRRKFVLISPSTRRLWQGRRTKAKWSYVEDEDAGRGVEGRRDSVQDL